MEKENIRNNLRLIYIAAIAVSLLVYPVVSASGILGVSGFVDNLAYLIIFLAALLAMFSIRMDAKRAVAVFGFIFFNIFFFWGNLLYYRFFSVSVGYDIFKQWKDAAPLASAVWTLIRWPDFVFMLFVPLALTGVAFSGGVSRRGMKFYAGLVSGAVLLILIHSIIWSGTKGYSKSNPLIGLTRQAFSVLWLEHFSLREFERISSDMSHYFPVNESLYEYSGDPRYPLLKRPLEGGDEDTGSRPNVVFILLESVRAFESGFYNRYSAGYTPNLDDLARGGHAFKNFYANSSGTVNGEFASLSSFYASQGGETMYNKFPRIGIKTLPSILRERGYRTAWISGFTSEYGNKGEFWRAHGIDEVHDSVPEPYTKLGWGPSDEDMFNNALNVLDGLQEPFYAEILTLSNHFEFNWDYPTAEETPPALGNKLYRDYTKGIYYTDYALGKFIAAAREHKFFSNTIFVITGDHGVVLFPDSKRINKVRVIEIYSRVPLVLYAPGMIEPHVDTRPASQVDILPTVLDLLGIRVENSFVGASLLRDDRESAPVLMKFVSVWSIRTGNEYCYDVGSIGKSSLQEYNEIMKDQDPMNPDRTVGAESMGNLRALFGYRDDDYYCFSTSKDILNPYKGSDLKPMDSERRNELISLGRDLSYMSSYLLLKDIIYPADMPVGR
jgi:glucan phosphoethanolaminetransferase (alkaline phosphatase superfamily)